MVPGEWCLQIYYRICHKYCQWALRCQWLRNEYSQRVKCLTRLPASTNFILSYNLLARRCLPPSSLFPLRTLFINCLLRVFYLLLIKAFSCQRQVKRNSLLFILFLTFNISQILYFLYILRYFVFNKQ